ncbi:MAG: hypothetical protein E7388_00720 [Ruminococcaceae bacterium]|nr:hypothetical protein [Oscillospiraceae bacterium]
MFLKLFRNDLKAIFKYWWLGAIISAAVSTIGIFPLRVLSNNNYYYSDAVYTICVLLLMLVFGSIFAFMLLTTILVFIRYFKNFFSDEGYLTFTLPVRRNQLLMSKLLSAIVAYAATAAVVVAEVTTMILAAFGNEPDFWWEIGDLVEKTPDFICDNWIYIIEGITLALVTGLFSILLLIVCVTFASVIAKKAKVFAAIGIYYGATTIVTTIFQVLYLFGGFWFINWVVGLADNISRNYAGNLIALLLFVLILFVSMFCVILYTLSLWMIDKKLNLS